MAFERLNEKEWQLLEQLVRTGKSLRCRPAKQHRQIFEAVLLNTLEANPTIVETSQGLKQNILATRRLAEQRQTQQPPTTSSSARIGADSHIGTGTGATSRSSKTLEAGSVNL